MWFLLSIIGDFLVNNLLIIMLAELDEWWILHNLKTMYKTNLSMHVPCT